MEDPKLQKVFEKFEEKIRLGQNYEAHQSLRTIVNRFTRNNEFKKAVDLLSKGSIIFSNKQDYASASDLISFLIFCYNTGDFRPSEKEHKMKLIELISYLPDDYEAITGFSKQSLEWSKKDGNKFGDCDLHHFFGLKLLNNIKSPGEIFLAKSDEEKQKYFSLCELHLVLGTHDSMNEYLNYMFMCFKNQKNGESDAGLYLSRVVINYAYLKNINFVSSAVDHYINKLINIEKNYKVIKEDDVQFYFFEFHPLMNFIQLMSITLCKECDPSNAKKFTHLINHYKPVLDKNKLCDCVDYLKEFYFNPNLSRLNNNQNMFASLLNTFLK